MTSGPDHAGHVGQDLGRQLFGMGALVHRLEERITARVAGTGCQHAFACIRCPMLRPGPAQRHRLETMITSLRERIAEADERGWLGEAEGRQTSLAAAEQKLIHMHRTATNLGQPILAMPKPRRST